MSENRSLTVNRERVIFLCRNKHYTSEEPTRKVTFRSSEVLAFRQMAIVGLRRGHQPGFCRQIIPSQLGRLSTVFAWRNTKSLFKDHAHVLCMLKTRVPSDLL